MQDPAQSCLEKEAGCSPAPLSAPALPDILRQAVEMKVNATDDEHAESQAKYPQLHRGARGQDRGAFGFQIWDSPPGPFKGQTGSPYPAQGL